MKANYHTHTARCKHASGSDEAYVVSAIKSGFVELGFSDHTPWRYNSAFVATMRMRENELSGYIDSVKALKEKYKDQISIKLGLECEYFPKYMNWLEEIIEREKLDYVIFGNHYYESDETGEYMGFGMENPQKLDHYVSSSIAGMESGIYACFCHPDLFLNDYDNFDENAIKACEKICAKAKELDFILEYNLGGKRYGREHNRVGYPNPKFWEIAAKYKCKAIVGVDAHNNRHLEINDDYNDARKYLSELGLELVDTIPLRKYD